MHRPPAVSYVAGRSRWHGLLLVGLWVAALGPIVSFSLIQPSGLSVVVLMGAWLVSGMLALRAWRASPAGLLQWDGQQWHWQRRDGPSDEAQACSLRAVWDVQQCVLVQLRLAEGRVWWLWLESAENRLQWNALRRALFSSADSGFTQPSPTADLEGQQ